jgi:hypothetical protein
MKPFWRSKTVWVSVVMLVSYVLAWPELTKWVDPQHIATASALITLILRILTGEKVSAK